MLNKWSIALQICQIASLLLFLKGFFPRKVTLSGFGTFDDDISPFMNNSRAHFDKLIVIVVDAMRSDFMYSSQDSLMSFLHSLIRNGSALPFTAFSHPPTVTLPRLKGITTGGTPSFVDAILNVADDKDTSQGLESVDSWLYQFKNMKSGRKIHFFGDDTWLKLFPPTSFFDRYEGTSSFFVSDFTEVDHNVTRHLQNEIDDKSWDALILHYLGLDHIGHKGGPNSTYMAPKQVEMDDVLRKLYLSRVANSNDTLLVLLGDHGMNDIGNHGGASVGETSPGLVLAAPKLASLGSNLDAPLGRSGDYKYYRSMSQIDLVPTLAALLNFPIPRNSLGILVREILSLWPDEATKNDVILENCKQLMNLLLERYGTHGDTYKSFLEKFQSIDDTTLDHLDLIYTLMTEIQSTLIEESTNYSYIELFSALGVIFVCTFAVWSRLMRSLKLHSANRLELDHFFAIFCFIYALHFHGSSLIEEEHQLWWFLSVTVLILHMVVSGMHAWKQFILTLMGLRIVRGWNDSGQKVFSNSAIADYLTTSTGINWLLVVLTYTLIAIRIHYQWPRPTFVGSSDGIRGTNWKLTFFDVVLVGFIAFISILSFSFKLNQFAVDGHPIPNRLQTFHHFLCNWLGAGFLKEKLHLQTMGIFLSQAFFLSLLPLSFGQLVSVKLGGCKVEMLKNTINVVTLLLVHQTRVEIIPIFMLFEFLKLSYCKLLRKCLVRDSRDSVVLLSLFVLCTQNLAFFSVGNTNLLATIDLSNAYNGILKYNIAAVGTLTFVSNYAVAIYWAISATEIIAAEVLSSRDLNGIKSLIFLRASLNSAFYSVSAFSLMGSCIHLRFHLFIWSVFSPKLLYFCAWLILINSGADFTFAFIWGFLKDL